MNLFGRNDTDLLAQRLRFDEGNLPSNLYAAFEAWYGNNNPVDNWYAVKSDLIFTVNMGSPPLSGSKYKTYVDLASGKGDLSLSDSYNGNFTFAFVAAKNQSIDTSPHLVDILQAAVDRAGVSVRSVDDGSIVVSTRIGFNVPTSFTVSGVGNTFIKSFIVALDGNVCNFWLDGTKYSFTSNLPDISSWYLASVASLSGKLYSFYFWRKFISDSEATIINSYLQNRFVL